MLNSVLRAQQASSREVPRLNYTNTKHKTHKRLKKRPLSEACFLNVLSIPRFRTPQRDGWADTPHHFLMQYLFMFTVPVVWTKASLSSPADPDNIYCVFISTWPFSRLSRFWYLWQQWWWIDCCHLPFSEVIAVTLLFSLGSVPESFLTNWFLTMRFSVSNTCLPCKFICFLGNLWRCSIFRSPFTVHNLHWLF